MTIPSDTTVLIIGGGPGGSYSACALQREGIDCVVLEAAKFPRYHIGESMLASMRHFLRFIDLDETFDAHGFNKKIGAAFKLNDKPEGFTDFIKAGGPGNYAWNVVRSEADDLIFKHAAKCGAKTFDGVEVQSIDFDTSDIPTRNGMTNEITATPGSPVSATWRRKEGGTTGEAMTGEIKFDYLIDASGRAGIVSTKYLKNRKHNQGLKNVANWGYWTGAAKYAEGTPREGAPFFEALSDASGWCWFIPLHNGTTSVGIVQNQDMATAKKRAMDSPNITDWYKESLRYAPRIQQFLSGGELTSGRIQAASDWSYSASCYATPKLRIVGDAGCFIDPYFSSGVHLALSGALSAATTICASIKGDVDEHTALDWHSSKVSEGYTRFLLVVLSALKQIRKQDQPVLSDWDEDGFEKAFAFFRPIIQGTADIGSNGSTKLSQDELSKTVDFCLNAFEHHDTDAHENVLKKMEDAKMANEVAIAANENRIQEKNRVDPEGLSGDELRILKTIRARQMLRTEDSMSIDSFTSDSLNGYTPLLKTGALTLVKAVGPRAEPKIPTMDISGRYFKS